MDSGMCVSMVSLSGQLFSDPSLKYIKLLEVIIILQTVEIDIPNKLVKCCSLKPCLFRHINIKNSVLVSSALDLPCFTLNSLFTSSLISS